MIAAIACPDPGAYRRIAVAFRRRKEGGGEDAFGLLSAPERSEGGSHVLSCTEN